MENELDLYLEHRPQMKTGDGLLWSVDTSIDPRTWVGSAIKLWSKGYNHASLILDTFEEITDHKYCLEALGNGVVLNQIGARLKKYPGKVYWLKARPEYEEWRSGVGAWALDKIGVKYDYSSIAVNIFRKASMGIDDLFCSEFLYGAWRWEALSLVLGTTDAELILDAWKSKDNIICGFGKAPRPAGILKMGIWEKPIVRIL